MLEDLHAVTFEAASEPEKVADLPQDRLQVFKVKWFFLCSLAYILILSCLSYEDQDL